MGIGHQPKSNNRLGQNKISYERYLGKDNQEQPDPIPSQSTDPISEDRDVPMPGNSSEEEPNCMAEKVKLSSSFISELLTHTIESSDIPKFFRDIKQMPIEDQKD